MGFRNYIREFLVAILMLFRPSGPCCLSVAEAPFLSLEIREFLIAILTLFRPSLPWCFPIRELSFGTEGAARAGAAAAEGKSN